MNQLDSTENLEIINQTFYCAQPMSWPLGKSAFIGYSDNVFDKDFCNEIINFCENNPEKSKPGVTLSGPIPNIKVSDDWILDQHYDFPSNDEQLIDKKLHTGIWSAVNLYRDSFEHLQHQSNNAFAGFDSGYQVQRYKKMQGNYRDHIDGSPWHYEVSSRTVTVIVYLNTVTEGGGTNFPLHNCYIEAVAGRIAIFPASWTHLHAGAIPLSSDKWIVSTFIHCA
jgi:hypothetical protein